jgi:hypothetical protein
MGSSAGQRPLGHGSPGGLKRGVLSGEEGGMHPWWRTQGTQQNRSPGGRWLGPPLGPGWDQERLLLTVCRVPVTLGLGLRAPAQLPGPRAVGSEDRKSLAVQGFPPLPSGNLAT